MFSNEDNVSLIAFAKATPETPAILNLNSLNHKK